MEFSGQQAGGHLYVVCLLANHARVWLTADADRTDGAMHADVPNFTMLLYTADDKSR
jgi:hypothetical protein